MPVIYSSAISCGVYQFYGVAGKTKLIEFFNGPVSKKITSISTLWQLGFKKGQTLVFSDAMANTPQAAEVMRSEKACGGWALEKLINKHELGTCARIDIGVNPNSGNRIALWSWTVNCDGPTLLKRVVDIHNAELAHAA